MTARAIISKSLMKTAADVALEKGVTIDVKPDGSFRVTPAIHKADEPKPVDRSAEIRL